MAYKKFVGTFQNETEVLNKIDELKTQGYSDNDIYIVRNDADVIGFLYRYNYYNKETDMPGLLEINIATVQDLFQLAHRTFWAIAEGEVKVEEDSELLDAIDYDDEAISKMVARNQLSIGKIKLYVIETREPELFAFYYSANVLEAHALHQDMFRETPKRMTNAFHLMPKLFHFDEMDAANILYFHRNKVVAYPNHLGHARAGERVLARMRA